jgi:3-hydroxyisobutyrate dehydrogenase-like beta-hydroxyacid dehydrogenase
MTKNNLAIGFIGFGEVAFNLSKDLKKHGVNHIYVYSRSTSKNKLSNSLKKRKSISGVQAVSSIFALAKKTKIIISAVHVDSALEVAEKLSLHIKPGSIFADLNNTVPAVKLQIAGLINTKGAQFVDIGLFESPATAGSKVAMYVSGDGAKIFKQTMVNYNMNIEVLSDQPGDAALHKTLANIYIKGIQALCLEMIQCAQKAGLDPNLLGSLAVKPVSNISKNKEILYWYKRGLISTNRKTKELKNIINEIKHLGEDPIMTEAALKRLQQVPPSSVKDFLD